MLGKSQLRKLFVAAITVPIVLKRRRRTQHRLCEGDTCSDREGADAKPQPVLELGNRYIFIGVTLTLFEPCAPGHPGFVTLNSLLPGVDHAEVISEALPGGCAVPKGPTPGVSDGLITR